MNMNILEVQEYCQSVPELNGGLGRRLAPTASGKKMKCECMDESRVAFDTRRERENTD